MPRELHAAKAINAYWFKDFLLVKLHFAPVFQHFAPKFLSVNP